MTSREMLNHSHISFLICKLGAISSSQGAHEKHVREMQSVSKISLNESGPVLGTVKWQGKASLRGKTLELMLTIEKEPAMEKAGRRTLQKGK